MANLAIAISPGPDSRAFRPGGGCVLPAMLAVTRVTGHGETSHALIHSVQRWLAGAGRAHDVAAFLAALLHVRELRVRVRERERGGCAGRVRRLVSWGLGIERLDDLNLNTILLFYFNDIFISIAFT